MAHAHSLPKKGQELPKGALTKKQELTTMQIVERDAIKYGLKLSPDAIHKTILTISQHPEYRVLRANNSLLLMHRKSQTVADGIMFTADGPQTFVTSLRQFKYALHKAGVREMTFPSSGLAIEPLLKRSGLQYSIKDVEGGQQLVTVRL